MQVTHQTTKDQVTIKMDVSEYEKLRKFLMVGCTRLTETEKSNWKLMVGVARSLIKG